MTRENQLMHISIVIPAYNEAAGIKQFHTTLLLPELKKVPKATFEVIYINDGSKDDTLEELHKIAKKSSTVKVVDLSRNFGKEIATTAGIFESKGDATIILDADGQHPPAVIHEFIKKWENGAQVVVGVRNKQQHEGVIKSVGSKVFYKLFNTTSGTELVPRSTDYRLISKEVRNEFKKFTERNRITRGLIDWLGFQRDYVYFDSPERIAGQASYKVSQLIALATNSFISLSLKPLFVFGWVGLAIIISSFGLGMFIIIEQFVLGDPLRISFSGSFMLGVFISFLIGTVLISQAILAAYISHIHTHSQSRPLYIVDKRDSRNLS